MNSPVIKQTWVVSSILLVVLGQGMVFGFTSGLLPALHAPDSSIQISLEAFSWLVAAIGMGNIFSYAICPIMMDLCGRRKAYAVSVFPAVVGMVMTFAAQHAATLICGRILAGFTFGASATVGAVAIGEYTSPSYRGMFLNLKTASFYVGNLAVHALGFYFNWRTNAMITSVPFALALIVTFTWPESPYWLAQRKQFSESEQIFYRLRGTDEESVKEIKELIETQTEKKQPSFADKSVEVIRKFKKRNFLKPAVIFFFAAILLEGSSRHIFPAFASQIITQLTGDTSHTSAYIVAVDLIFLVSAFFSSYLIKITKLRNLLFTTGAASCIVLALACFYLYLGSKDLIPINAVGTMCLFGVYFVLTNLGCAPVPLALIGEIFPLEHKAVGAAAAGYLLTIAMTITFKITPYMLLKLEIYQTFALLALSTALMLLVLYFILPETKNKTLQEIEDYFNPKKSNRNINGENDATLQILKRDSVVRR